jgi:chorismate mutase
MSQPADPAAELGVLRTEIDRIDLLMHEALMERGEIIARLIEVKKRQGGGSAFRPDREVEMMRRIVGRHKGLLPVDTVESIWRVIIATFTWVQANYGVHVDVSSGDAGMRDSARFHFGFTAPFVPHQGAGAVIRAVAAARNDLGLLHAIGVSADGAWWRPLEAPGAPKIIARLPFVERADHPAGTPVFVIAHPLATPTMEVALYGLALERWHDALPAALAAEGGSLVGNAASAYGLSLLAAVPGEDGAGRLSHALRSVGAPQTRLAFVGSHAARFGLDDGT